MARALAPLTIEFEAHVKSALAVAVAGEVALAARSAHPALRAFWHYSRVELVYELAYLRIFVQWETFLEECFSRLLCGYTTGSGREPLVAGVSFERTVRAAHLKVLGGRPYKLWHNPDHVVSRAKRFFNGGRIETVLSSNIARLRSMADIRHRVAHNTNDVRAKFDVASMALAGARYPGARAGRFLRETVLGASPPRRWIDDLATELTALARQVTA